MKKKKQKKKITKEMSRQVSHRITPFAFLKEAITDYAQLVKFRLTIMVVFTAVAAYMIASTLQTSAISIVLLAFGGFCVAGASNALNQVLEKDYDRLMTRTKDRPVAAGRMSPASAVFFAGFLCLMGITTLAFFNPLTAFFGMMAFVLYAFLYTPLKRFSPAAIFVGAVAGAMPMLIGAVAWEGSLTWLAVLLFAIQLAWQYPHFWAIGYLGFDDYSKAGFKFVPSRGEMPDRSIGLSSLLYASLLLVFVCALYMLDISGWIATGMAAILTLTYWIFSWKFYREFNQRSAKLLMLSSLFYLPLVLLILLIDKMG